MKENIIFKNESLEWINITGLSASNTHLVAEKFNINPLFLEDCLDKDHLPKYEESEHLKFILARYSLSTESYSQDSITDITQPFGVFLFEEKIITISHLDNAIIKKLSEKLNSQDADKVSIHTIALEISLLIMESFDAKSEYFEERTEDIEKEIFLKQIASSKEIKKLYFLKRMATINQKVVFSSLEWIKAIEKLPISKSEYIDLKDKYMDVSSSLEHIGYQCDSLIKLYLAISDQKNNEVMKLLTIYSAYFLPISFIAGFYGMNFLNIPGMDHHLGFFITVTLMVLIVIITFIYMKRKKIF